MKYETRHRVGGACAASSLGASSSARAAPASAGPPNTNVCHDVHSGSLARFRPRMKSRFAFGAVRAALALGCSIAPRSIFARKQYFYPDLPGRADQISQYEEPFSQNGQHLDFVLEGETKRVRILRAHMEEDAGKSVHGVGGDSLVDLNRAGVALAVEIVSEPDLRFRVKKRLRTCAALREVLIFAGVNDGNLEEGSFRCDANVSVRPVGQEKLGSTRTELKNLNSFRFVHKAIDVEVARQIAILDSGGRITPRDAARVRP